jgi:capsule polysaccharide export protein KpsC/LpsZ
MSGNVIQTTFDEFLKSQHFAKKGGSWFRTGDDVITVVQLQKSNYGLQYYVNVALWLRPLGEATFPKEQTCHVRSRLDDLVGLEQDRLRRLLDLESDMSETDRRSALVEFFVMHLRPVLEAVDGLGLLRTPEGQRFLAAALVTGPAQRVVAT